MTPKSGEARSAIGKPTRTGGSAACPEVYITPLSAWMMVSIALPSSAPPVDPKPLIEQYTRRGFTSWTKA